MLAGGPTVIVDSTVTKTILTNKRLVIGVSHHARIDPFLIGLLPYSVYKLLTPVRFMTANKYWGWWWIRALTAGLGAYGLKKTAWSYQDFFDETLRFLKLDQRVLIFPTGKMIKKGEKTVAKEGVGYLILEKIESLG
jgi:1-acyl-sn-glycerol-3-phosphate acyltransferase